MRRKLTFEELVERANKKHNNKFYYLKSGYEDRNSVIEIICPIHGSFKQPLYSHIHSIHGCNLCSPTAGAAITQEQYIAKCQLKHKNKYDYSETIYDGIKKQIKIICPIHGEFLQRAEHHYIYGCSACAGNKRGTTEKFIEKSKIIHDNYYDYSLVKYNGTHAPVIIICPVHGQFNQAPSNHLKKKGCSKCSLGNTSNIEHTWLDSLKIPLENRNIFLKINNRKVNVDGYYNNIIYEFLGDFWHGNPGIYDKNEINKACKKTFGFLFDKTRERIKFLRENGFKVISIWESKFKKCQKK